MRNIESPLRREPARRNASTVAAEREYSLLSLIDLSQALTLSLDPYRIADSLLLSLRGQFQVSRACLWLVPAGGAPLPVLVRAYGVPADQARTVMSACAHRLTNRFRDVALPVTVEELEPGDPGSILPITRAGIRILAPVSAGEEVMGIVALGARGDDAAYRDLDVQALRASLAIAGVALQNARFHGRLLERTRELRAVSERLRDLDRLKSEFLANINHELRTPLSVVIASLDCLTRLEESAAPGHEFVEFATRQSKKLQGMIESILTFSAASEGSLPPDLVPGDVGAFVDAYYQERLPGIATGLREFTCAREGASLSGRFDPDHLRQILDALIDNAVKFTSAGSRIQLQVATAREACTEWIRIDVVDDGPGMSQGTVPEMFEPFRQGDGSATRLTGGMGIGLALAQRLAEGLGGRLTCESRAGGGTTFSLLLPADVQFSTPAADDSDRRRTAMSSELEIVPVEIGGGTAVVRLKGRLDVRTAPLLLQQARDIQTNGQDLVLNLSEVSFVGSSGVGALLVIAEQFHEQAGRVRFASPSPPVAAVFKLLNLHRFLTIDSTEDDAVAALQA